MLAQIRSELLKLATVRTTWLFGLATTVLVALLVVLQAASAGGDLLAPLTDPATQQALFGSAEPVTLIAIVFGCLALTTEFRHHTIVTTLLSDPQRPRVVLAKAVGALAGGAALAVVAVTVATLGSWLVLSVTGTPGALAAGELTRGAAGTVAAAALGSLFGMGIGGVVRNQALAVGATLLLLLAVEPLVSSLVPVVGRWLPSSLATTLASGQSTPEIALGAALAALAAYGIGAATASVVLLRRADIT